MKTKIKTLPRYKDYIVNLKNWEFRKGEQIMSLLSDRGARLFWEFRQTEDGRKAVNK